VVEVPKAKRKEEIQRIFACPLDVDEGPQLRVFLVRDAQQDSLCLIINHMVCDAVGYKNYLTEVARLYSRIAEGLEPSPTPFVRQRGTRAVLRGFTLRDRLRVPFAATLAPGAEEIREFRQNAGFAFESGTFDLLTMSLPATSFKPIRTTVKALGFTVNDLFMASLALACHRVRKVDKILLPCTMDLRRFAPPGIKMGVTNLSSRCPCVISVSPNDMIENVMAKVVEPMKVYKQGFYAVNNLISWQLLLKSASPQQINQIFQDGDLTFPLSATNLGVIDEDSVRFGNVSVRSAHMAAPAAPPISLFTAISTFRDELTISVCIESDDTAKDFVHAIFSAMTEELLAFGSRHQAGSIPQD
jgi:NRPS condensation-like uncharacterized protein